MLSRVPLENVVILKCRKIHDSGERPIPDDLKAILDVGNNPKWIGVRHKGKIDVVKASPKKSTIQRKTKSKKSKHELVYNDSENRI